jgi:dienelactone hydrolase
VFFASMPGHYVSGNLYRPKDAKSGVPGILCPHGHWHNGRFYERPEAQARDEMKQGAEATMNGARYPLQARCAMLARMGCVVFHYDMVGVADSKPIEHAAGFADADGELRLQSAMGLQTWNSIRALDFLLSLPEVDKDRIGVTGASGGGTQTFILGALDDRPAVAFPAVMVGTEMQGGCVCENASYLRQFTGNVELAGMFAPKPLGMTGANDWTLHIETKGLPELKTLYKLYDAEDRVLAKCFPQFEHNYNQVSREVMYNWFNKHLKLGWKEPVKEEPFEPVPPAELSVYNEQHPRPKDALPVDRLRQQMAESSDKQIAALLPKDGDSLKEYYGIIGTALRVMIHDQLPGKNDVVTQTVGPTEEKDGLRWRKFLLSRKGESEQIPAYGVRGEQFDGTVVVWVHPDGKSSLMRDGKLVPAAQQIIDRKGAILAPDVMWTGEARHVVVRVFPDPDKLKSRQVSVNDLRTIAETLLGKGLTDLDFVMSKRKAEEAVSMLKALKVRNQNGQMVLMQDVAAVEISSKIPFNGSYAGYTFGYNRPLLANRVHDILTAVAMAKGREETKTIHLVGFDAAGPWVALARGLCGDAITRSAVDFHQFRFDAVKTKTDEMMLPGSLKYGGLGAFTARAAPGELFVHNHRGTGAGQWLTSVYKAAGHPERLHRSPEQATPEKAVEWLLR